jgi:hypothetical protein
MADYSRELDELQKRLDAVTKKLDWGAIWDMLKEMHETMNAQESFRRDCGVRDEFIRRKENGEI